MVRWFVRRTCFCKNIEKSRKWARRRICCTAGYLLDASSRLYRRVCWPVRWFVGHTFVKIAKKGVMDPNVSKLASKCFQVGGPPNVAESGHQKSPSRGLQPRQVGAPNFTELGPQTSPSQGPKRRRVRAPNVAKSGTQTTPSRGPKQRQVGAPNLTETAP